MDLLTLDEKHRTSLKWVVFEINHMSTTTLLYVYDPKEINAMRMFRAMIESLLFIQIRQLYDLKLSLI